MIFISKENDPYQFSVLSPGFLKFEEYRQRIMRTIFTFSFFLISISLFSQDLSGHWEGYITQDGKTDTFLYQVDFQAGTKSYPGTSFSQTKDGANSASFQLTAYLDGQQLILQELNQIDPPKPKWCLKYATLTLEQFPFHDRLRGRWKADGCTPGDMMLERRKIPLDEEKEEVIPPTINGKWTGTLSQSDRDYGFYFEADLHEGRRGQSYIVSEDNGGSAFHKLEWRYDSIFQLLSFKELEVASKTDPRWQWCIKSGTLSFRREASRLVLEGDWNGFIEGYDLDTGPCANGSVYLEKPILTRRMVQKQSMLQQPYEAESKRTIKVERVLEVQSSSIKIKVWDNGTVDGDVATLFLNGERILHEFRVDKRKFGIPVKLNQNDNFLVLHAESLGDISPNTVAISVDDGVKEQIIILSSNLNESGAVMIRKFQVSN